MADDYIIFLPDRYLELKTSCFCTQQYREKVVMDLENKGVTVRGRSGIRAFIDSGRRKMFNNKHYPQLNTLYIRLSDGEYYTADLYGRKKLQKEQEILMLIAGKLGVSTIEYTIETFETTLRQVSVSAKVQDVDIGGGFKKSRVKKDTQTGKEVYLNRGAPVYCLSKSMAQVENNIRTRLTKLTCNLFSYDFYRNNPNLQSFVYKRFGLKMSEVEYTAESEDTLEMNFDVRMTLMSYGIGVEYNSHVGQTQKITYTLKFFNDTELRIKLGEVVRLHEDPFAIVFEEYGENQDKTIAIFSIMEYVKKYAKKVKYKVYSGEDVIGENNYRAQLEAWINNGNMDKFAEICRSFTSSYHIKTWLRNTFRNDSVYHDDPDESDAEDYGILKFKKRNYRVYRQNLMDSDIDSDDEGDEFLARDAAPQTPPTPMVDIERGDGAPPDNYPHISEESEEYLLEATPPSDDEDVIDMSDVDNREERPNKPKKRVTRPRPPKKKSKDRDEIVDEDDEEFADTW